MSPPKNFEDISAPASAGRTARVDVDAGAIDACRSHGGGTGAPPRRAHALGSPGAIEATTAGRRNPRRAPPREVAATLPGPAAAASDAAAPSGRIGQYEIIRQIGCGGMGTVYLARDRPATCPRRTSTPR